MVVYEDDYVRMEVFPDTKIFNDYWKPVPKTDEQWIRQHIIMLDMIMKYDVDKVLSYSDESIFPVHPELQEWFEEESKKRGVLDKIKKVAVVLPKDFIVKLGIEQLAEEATSASGTQTMYFDDRQEAYDWLIKS